MTYPSPHLPIPMKLEPKCEPPDLSIARRWANYLITHDGRIYSLAKERYLRPVASNLGDGRKNGYLQTILKGPDGVLKNYKVHRLVALLFVDNPLDKPEVNHRDGNKLNNHYTNLEWVTHAENIKHSYEVLGRQGKGRGGKNHWTARKKFSKRSKEKMRKAKLGENHPKFKGWYWFDGEKYASLRELSVAMGVSTTTAMRKVRVGLIANFEPVQK